MHPFNIKMSAFHSMLNPLVNTPLSQSKKKLYTIKTIAVNNGYEAKIIDTLLNNKIKALTLNSIFPQATTPQNKYRKIPALGSISQKISKELKQLNLVAAFTTRHTIRNSLVNNKLSKDRRDKYKQSGVYEIKWTCGNIYIGKKLSHQFKSTLKDAEKQKTLGSGLALSREKMQL